MRHGRPVVLRTRTVGSYFGTVGQVVDLTGEVVAEGDVRPYGFTSRALRDVALLADELGCAVLSDDEAVESGADV